MAQTSTPLTKNQRAYLRLIKKFRKAEIARMAGVTRQALGKWEAVPGPHVEAIAKASGLLPKTIRPEPYSVP